MLSNIKKLHMVQYNKVTNSKGIRYFDDYLRKGKRIDI